MNNFMFKLSGIEWGQNKDKYLYYFYWFDLITKKENRFIGYEYVYFDKPHVSFGFWWFCITWSTPYTKVKK